eukprot:scaffold3904_cov47-Attheya_sp.AAC.4
MVASVPVPSGSTTATRSVSATSAPSMGESTVTGATTTSTTTTSTAEALQLLLREDPLLTQHGLVGWGNGGASASASARSLEHGSSSSSLQEETYAAALLQSGSGGDMQMQQRAAHALAHVERKLALVTLLAERVSREFPQEVAGPLLRLHGHHPEVTSWNNNPDDPETEDDTRDAAQSSTEEGASNRALVMSSGEQQQQQQQQQRLSLMATREKCVRLKRQGELLEGVATRVESSLQRGLRRMERATSRLQRVLQISATLKMALRLKFEAKKIRGSGLDLTSTTGLLSSSSSSLSTPKQTHVDLRDLTRAAASVAIMEDLLQSPELKASSTTSLVVTLEVVEAMRPEAEQVAKAVRRAAAGLLQQTSKQMMNPAKLGATLLVFFHLGELPEAVWGSVQTELAAAEAASSQLFHPQAIQDIFQRAQSMTSSTTSTSKPTSTSTTAATTDAQDNLEANNDGSNNSNSKNDSKKQEQAQERAFQSRLRELKAEAATQWASQVSEAALKVWNLHRVLARKSDPVTRQNFLDAVSAAPVPPTFQPALSSYKQTNTNTTTSTSSTNQHQQQAATTASATPSLFGLFWQQFCIGLGQRLQRLLAYEKTNRDQIAGLYPSVRAAALEMVATLYDTMQAGISSSTTIMSHSNSTALDDANDAMGGSNYGIMGGSASLEDSFLGWTGGGHEESAVAKGNSGLAGWTSKSADTWTRSGLMGDVVIASSANNSMMDNKGAPVGPSSSMSAIFLSSEWMALQGTSRINSSGNETTSGLLSLQTAFLEASAERLTQPLQFLFPASVDIVDENGVTMSVLPSLPTRFDLQLLDTTIRNELSLADPRKGGGEFSMTTLLSDTIVEQLVEQFCDRARGATSDAASGGDHSTGYLHDDSTPTEALLHDMQVASVLSSLATILRTAPENTFVVPYRPAQSPQHEEAANMCEIALLPALHEIERLVKSTILTPLCCALNQRVAAAIAKLHQGIYLEDIADAQTDEEEPSLFVQQHLAGVYEGIATHFLSKLPAEYARIVATTVATYSIYSFVSNAALVRPLGEIGRLRITQDLADLELCLEQLVAQGGGYNSNSNMPSSSSLALSSLSQMDHGKPYAELRAVRQMLFWTGLESTATTTTTTTADICKDLLRQVWIKDVRPSTVLAFLFSFAPQTLSSPHHWKRMRADEYVSNDLIQWDGSIDDGEAGAWMTTMACCDSYQQRESVSAATAPSSSSSDPRVAAILMMLGPELLRRRRH